MILTFLAIMWNKLYLVHCKTPFISKVDQMVSPETSHIKSTWGLVLAMAAAKQHYAKVPQELSSILNNSKPLRVTYGGLPRVSIVASISTNIKYMRVIADTKFIHQQQIWNNTPMLTILEEETKWSP